MRVHLLKLLAGVAALSLPAFGFIACSDALHLDPPGTTTHTVVSEGGAAEGGTTACVSNPDCLYPTPVCDTVKQNCVQCLVLSDCAGNPGTVCSEGSCTCPPGIACLGTRWSPTSTLDAPAARSHHVAIWTGSKMIVWGGQSTDASPLNTGGVYDPATNTWTAMSTPTSLEGRYDATAVWDTADNLMLVFGGAGASGLLGNGWRYDPATDKWSPMANIDPGTDGGTDDAGTTTTFAGRAGHSAVWATGISTLGSTKSAMIVWGGVTDATSGTTAGDGAIYDPATDQWTLIAAGASGAPAARAYHAAAWNPNGVMLVLGGASTAGSTATLADDTLYSLVPGSSWNTLTGTPPPSARLKHTGIWDPVTMAFLVWGGSNGAATPMYFQDGSSLSTSNTWTTFGASGTLPAGRVDHSSVVLAGPKGSQLVIFGGDNAGGILGDGWALDTSPGGVWSSLATPGPGARKNHTAVATTAPGASTLGTRMIVWGGETATGVYTNSGAVYTAQ